RSVRAQVAGSGPRFAALYADFTDRFRGSTAEVTTKLAGYLPDVHRLVGAAGGAGGGGAGGGGGGGRGGGRGVATPVCPPRASTPTPHSSRRDGRVVWRWFTATPSHTCRASPRTRSTWSPRSTSSSTSTSRRCSRCWPRPGTTCVRGAVCCSR